MKASRLHNILVFIIALSVFFNCAGTNSVRAQSADENAGTTVDTGSSGDRENYAKSEPLYANQEDDTTMTRLAPTEALLRSLFFPGWGQLSNKKYIKAGIVITAEVLILTNLVHYIEKTEDARQAFETAINDTEKAIRFNEYQDAEDDRSRFGWYLGTLIFISMFDAFVDAHLTDFPQKSENLTLTVNPVEDGGLTVNIALNF